MDKKSNFIDIMKVICCLLIIGSHSLPIFYHEELNFFYGQWLFRFCVPFFFIVTGFFFETMDDYRRMKYIERIALIYVVSTLLYLPVIVKNFSIRSLLFGYHHLWYLAALIFGLILYHTMDKLFGEHKKAVMIVSFAILGGGIILDEWHAVFNNNFIDTLSHFVEKIGGSRNGLFFAFPMLSVGGLIRRNNWSIKKNEFIVFLLISFILGFCEAAFLKYRCGKDVTLDVTLFGWLPAIPLFLLSLKKASPISDTTSRLIRKTVDIAYVIHVWIIVFVCDVICIRYELGFICILFITFMISVITLKLIISIRKACSDNYHT